jgi:hypothetical protein
MQTHGDKNGNGGSFDLLRDEIKEEDEDSQENKSEGDNSQNVFDIETSQRLNTDHQIYTKSTIRLINNQELISPNSASLHAKKKHSNSTKKANPQQKKVKAFARTKKERVVKSDEECIVPGGGSSGNKASGIETDVPGLEKKIQQQPRIKLVLNLPSYTTMSSSK